MQMGTYQRLCNETNLELYVNDESLMEIADTSYLGLTLDEHLSWAKYILILSNKLAQKVAILRRLMSKVPSYMLQTIYNTIIQPHIDYCISVWGYAPDVHISKIQRLQNRAARVITGIYDWTIDGVQLVKQLGWLTVKERRDYFTAILMYRCLNGMAPHYLSDNFMFVSESHNYVTRMHSEGDLNIPKPNIELFRQSISYQGPKMWNSLSHDVRNSGSLMTFKRSYKATYF